MLRIVQREINNARDFFYPLLVLQDLLLCCEKYYPPLLGGNSYCPGVNEDQGVIKISINLNVPSSWNRSLFCNSCWTL